MLSRFAQPIRRATRTQAVRAFQASAPVKEKEEAVKEKEQAVKEKELAVKEKELAVKEKEQAVAAETQAVADGAAAAEAGLSQIRSKMASAGWTPDDVTSGDLDLYDSLAKAVTTCGCARSS